MFRFLLLLFFLLFTYYNSFSQLRFTGNFNQSTAIEIFEPNEFSLLTNTVHAQLEYSADQYQFIWNNRFKNHAHISTDSLLWDIPELLIKFYLPNGDLIIGRQILNWGFSDNSPIGILLNPLDISNFAIEPVSDLQLGINAFSYRHYFNEGTLDAVINIQHQSYRLPRPVSGWFPRLSVPPDLTIDYKSQDEPLGLHDIQGGLQWQTTLGTSLDIAAQVLYWRNVIPSYFKNAPFQENELPERIIFEERIQQSLIVGLGIQYRFADGWTFRSEQAFTKDSFTDVFPDEIFLLQEPEISLNELNRVVDTLMVYNEFGFLDTKPGLSSSSGISYQSGNRFAQVNFDFEYIFEYEDRIAQKDFFPSLSFIARDSFLRELLEVQLIVNYNFEGNDFWIFPSVTYDIIDNINITAGAHLFGGDPVDDFYGHLSYRQYKNQSLIFTRLSFFW